VTVSEDVQYFYVRFNFKHNEVSIHSVKTTYIDYTDFGYSAVPENEFARYSDMAEKTIRRFIKSFTGFTNFTDGHKRCICEIAEILYKEHNQLNRPIAGFGNENYREQYFEGRNLSAGEQVWEIIRLYFTQEELYRGI